MSHDHGHGVLSPSAMTCHGQDHPSCIYYFRYTVTDTLTIYSDPALPRIIIHVISRVTNDIVTPLIKMICKSSFKSIHIKPLGIILQVGLDLNHVRPKF